MNDPAFEPIFVGGVGRSGTHPMGRLIAADPHYHWIRTEVRFHASAGGLPDLCRDRTRMDRFLARMRGHWYRRGARRSQGLQRIVDAPQYEAALEEFQPAFEHDRIDASRRLVTGGCSIRGCRRRQAGLGGDHRRGRRGGPFLLELFPAAKFVNMIPRRARGRREAHCARWT